jgi:hypothetical protein
MVLGVDRCRQISEGQIWSNTPETRVNADASQIDGKSDGKAPRGGAKFKADQWVGRLVDD